MFFKVCIAWKNLKNYTKTALMDNIKKGGFSVNDYWSEIKMKKKTHYR